MRTPLPLSAEDRLVRPHGSLSPRQGGDLLEIHHGMEVFDIVQGMSCV
jgi:hypothetical protein